MAAVPVAAEATAVGLCLGLWLNLNVFMALAGGLILSSVCPALLHSTMCQWQHFKLGTDKGKPVLRVPCLRGFQNYSMSCTCHF